VGKEAKDSPGEKKLRERTPAIPLREEKTTQTAVVTRE